MGDPTFVIVISIFGWIPFLMLVTGFLRIVISGFDPPFNNLSVLRRTLLFGSLLLLLALVLAPSIWFLWVLWSEYSFQSQCSGGACAQGGMGVLLASFIEGAFVFVMGTTARVLKKIGALPTRAEIDLSLPFRVRAKT